MRIISWNVLAANLKVDELIDHTLELKPDIICLQEIPGHIFNKLKKLDNYNLDFVNDSVKLPPRKGSGNYICTLTHNKHQLCNRFSHHAKQTRSILSRVVYNKLAGLREVNYSLYTDIKLKDKDIRIINTRLSCAVGAKTRIEQLKRLLGKVDPKKINFVCGDFNIINSFWFNLLTGWTRAFHFRDYFINERREANKLFAKFGLKNIFEGYPTIHRWRFVGQVDHILIPNNVKVKYKKVSKNSFGSDHEMLLVDLRL